MSEEQWLNDFGALLRLSFEGDNALREIAALLRRGNVDQRILELLANIIDPDQRSFIGEKLVVKRVAGHRPKKRPNYALSQFMETNLDFYNEKYEAVVAAAKEKFGVGKTACDEALAQARKRQKADPAFFQLQKRIALYLRDSGDPEYSPLA
jgi:hypothetical protein